MDPGRRSFLALAATTALLGPGRLIAADRPQRLLSCRSDYVGRHYATLFDDRGRILLDVPLPGRGHAITLSHNRRTAVVLARRPGDFMVVLDLVERRERLRVQSAADRHFYGHGVFSHDDALLYTTQNAFDEGAGRIGVYDVRSGFRLVDELDSFGVGPHELRLLADGRTLVVANGGIRTHPDRPRAKLNLDEMRSSLVYVDRNSGRLRERLEAPPEWRRLSIRHIDVNADGLVAMAMQYEGGRRDLPPLIATHRRSQDVQWLQAPPEVQSRLRNYCGSVAFAADGHSFAVTSPRGGVVTKWSADGRFVDVVNQDDVCGIAATPRGTWSSDGLGGLALRGDRVLTLADTRWDNHLSAL